MNRKRRLCGRKRTIVNGEKKNDGEREKKEKFVISS